MEESGFVLKLHLQRKSTVFIVICLFLVAWAEWLNSWCHHWTQKNIRFIL